MENPIIECTIPLEAGKNTSAVIRHRGEYYKVEGLGWSGMIAAIRKYFDGLATKQEITNMVA